MLATASLFTGDYAKGVEYALLGITDAPHLPSLRVYLAMNLVGLGDIERAKEAFDVARRMAPAWADGRGVGRGIVLGTPEHHRRVSTFRLIAAGLEDPSAADALR